MFGRLATVAALITLAACANMEPAGRNAARNGEVSAPREVARATAPAPLPTRPAPTPLPSPPSSSSASSPAPMTNTPTPAPTVVARATPAPAPVTASPAPSTSVASPPVVAPSVAAPATTRPPRRNSDEEVIVPGQVRRQIPVPEGDPRSVAERMQDINSWDRCVTHVQAAFESDPMRPQLQTPEEYCAQSLGMADRNAVPQSRVSSRRQR